MTDNRTQSEFILNLCEEYRKNNRIDPALYNDPEVKRGLRNANGTGVIAGLSQIGDVVGYDLRDGERVGIPGKLYYRGYDLEDLINGFIKEGRYGFEEVSYLLLFGKLPTPAQFKYMSEQLGILRQLPDFFTEDQILKSPARTS